MRVTKVLDVSYTGTGLTSYTFRPSPVAPNTQIQITGAVGATTVVEVQPLGSTTWTPVIATDGASDTWTVLDLLVSAIRITFPASSTYLISAYQWESTL